jgi:hypothetical protein
MLIAMQEETLVQKEVNSNLNNEQGAFKFEPVMEGLNLSGDSSTSKNSGV